MVRHFGPVMKDGDGAGGGVFLNAYNRSTVADMWLLLDTNKKSYLGSPTASLDLILSNTESLYS